MKLSELRLSRIPLIDISDRSPFSISFPKEPPSRLVESVKSLGIITPPILIERMDAQSFEIVVGARRVAAAVAAGFQDAACLMIPQGVLSEAECLLAALHDNLSARETNTVEKAIAVRLLSGYFTKEEVLKTYMPMLGLPPREDCLKIYLSVEKDLPRPMKIALAEGRLSLKSAEQLLLMEPSEAKRVFDMIEKLRLNHNYQLQFIDLIIDICNIEKITIGRLMLDIEAEESCWVDGLSTPQRARRTMDLLRDRRNPVFAHAKRRFDETISSLKLEKGDTITAPRAFEVPHLEAHLSFKNRAELVEKARRLALMEDIDFLFEPWKAKKEE